MTAPQPLSRAGASTLLGVACLTIMVGCVIVPGLTRIAPALGVEQGADWLVTMPSLGVVVLGPLAGGVIQRLGARRALCVGLALYGVLGMGTVFLRGPAAVLTIRCLLGGATAIVMAAGTSLLASFYDGEARLAMMARQGMAIEMGGVVFLFAGGLLAGVGWAMPFALYGIAFVLLGMVLALVPDPGRPSPGNDLRQVSDARGPMLLVQLVGLASMTCFFVAIVTLPFRLSAQGRGAPGFDSADVGYLLSFVSLVAVGAASQMPIVTRRVGTSRVLAAAFLAYALAHLCFLVADGVPGFLAGAVLLGVGFGLSIPLANVLAVDLSPPSQRGRNLAALAMAIFLGQFLSSFAGRLPLGGSGAFVAAAVLASAMTVVTFVHPHLRLPTRPSTDTNGSR